MKHQSEFEDKNDSVLGFSGKLKSVNSVVKEDKRRDVEVADVNDDASYSSDSYGPQVYEKKRIPHTFDSGELHFSIYSQYKPSTPARITVTKVHYIVHYFICSESN